MFGHLSWMWLSWSNAALFCDAHQLTSYHVCWIFILYPGLDLYWQHSKHLYVYSFYLFYFIFLKSIPRFLEEKVHFICLLVEYFVCKVEFNCLKIVSISLSVCVCVWETQTERESQCACVEVRSQLERIGCLRLSCGFWDQTQVLQVGQ